MKNELLTLRSKKLGLMLKQIRESHDQSEEGCANWLGISLQEYHAIEDGSSCASLPQIESLSYFLNFPFEFVTNLPNSDTFDNSLPQPKNNALVELRNKTIAILLKQKREEKKLSINQLSQNTDLPVDEIESYEGGSLPVPFTALLSIVEALEMPLDQLFSQDGPFKHEEMSSAGQTGSLPANLSEEMVNFISKPANHPYLELAMRISKLDANKIRSIASSLLEITY
jgi:transcriptional regulator with XRE-family HTH domain